jgi:GTP cyclohydrolase I
MKKTPASLSSKELNVELLRSTSPEEHMHAIIQALYPNFPWDDHDSGERTAARFVAYLREYQPTSLEDLPFKLTVFESSVNQMIGSGPITFSSICKHHLLPYHGLAWVAYLPNKWMIGASKMPRLVKTLATKPSTQEELTSEIATILKLELEAMGVAVTLRATHTCMSCRGVREESAQLITSEMRGVFLTAPEARNEFINLIVGR